MTRTTRVFHRDEPASRAARPSNQAGMQPVREEDKRYFALHSVPRTWQIQQQPEEWPLRNPVRMAFVNR